MKILRLQRKLKKRMLDTTEKKIWNNNENDSFSCQKRLLTNLNIGL